MLSVLPQRCQEVVLWFDFKLGRLDADSPKEHCIDVSQTLSAAFRLAGMARLAKHQPVCLGSPGGLNAWHPNLFR